MTTKLSSWRSAMRVRDEKGKAYELGAVLGRGGEAAIWSVKWRRRLVAKIYHTISADREKKLRAMVDRPPLDPPRSGKHISICWPQSLLFDQHRRVVGFLMPRIDMAHHRELFRISTPSTRRSEAPGFTWAYLVAAAENISIVVGSIHSAGYVIGDVNESNFFISANALASIVDCDSMQVVAASGVYRCTVAKTEYLPPELYRADLASRIRMPDGDNFALAVLIFQMLMEGIHPYAGKWHGSGDPPPLEERIAHGDTPYGGSARISPSPIAPPFEILPLHIQQLFVRAFLHGTRDPSRRPSATEWQQGLRQLSASIASCSINPRHWYSNHLARCPWCDRTVLFGFDPYPANRVGPRDKTDLRKVTEARFKPGIRALANKKRLVAEVRRLLLTRRALDALVVATPVVGALLAALLVGAGVNRLGWLPRETVALAALMGCLRAVQTRRYRQAMVLLAGGALFTLVFPKAFSHASLSSAILEGILAFCVSHVLLEMLRTSLERLRARGRATAIAWILGTSLVLCPAISLVVALAAHRIG